MLGKLSNSADQDEYILRIARGMIATASVDMVFDLKCRLVSDYGEAASKAWDLALQDYESSFNVQISNRNAIEKNQGIKLFSEYLSRKLNIKTLDNRDRKILVYGDGIFVDGINLLKAEIQRILKEVHSLRLSNEIVEKIRNISLTRRDEFEPPLNLICVGNGVFDLQSNKLLPHSPDYRFLSKVASDYNPDARCELFEWFLSDRLEDSYIPLIQEWLGFLLYRRHFLKKAMIIVGERDTGKTTLLDTIIAFIGKDNKSTVPLQSIGSDKFATAALYGKYLNCADDLNSSDISNVGSFKAACGDGFIDADVKFETRFSFVNYAKLMFACNSIPVARNEDDEAYFSRWLVVPFMRGVKERDVFLIDKLTTKDELSGILNFALAGLQRLLNNKHFSVELSPGDTRDLMLLHSNSPIAQFVRKCLVQGSPENYVTKDEMHREFELFCNSRRLSSVTVDYFGKNFLRFCHYGADGQAVIKVADKTEHVRVWRSVILKHN